MSNALCCLELADSTSRPVQRTPPGANVIFGAIHLRTFSFHARMPAVERPDNGARPHFYFFKTRFPSRAQRGPHPSTLTGCEG